MTFGAARDLSSQVVAIPMTSFGMLMNSPGSEFQRISPQKRASVPASRRYAPGPGAHDLAHLYFRLGDHTTAILIFWAFRQNT